ncbi:MAG: non-canonical purine NTP pyrophosphatase [Candidatus Aenigmatarchaeota archaeon]
MAKEKKIIFVTGNRSKFEEASAILGEVGVELVQKNMEFKETRTLSQEEVVREKARLAYARLKRPVLADDTGIYFEAYSNFPGTFTRYVFSSLGFDGIKRLLKGKSRRAFFQTMVCLMDGKGCMVFSGKWRGRIISDGKRISNPDWPYNDIFVPDGFTLPLAKIPNDIRFKKSHRRKALAKLARYLRCKK